MSRLRSLVNCVYHLKHFVSVWSKISSSKLLSNSLISCSLRQKCLNNNFTSARHFASSKDSGGDDDDLDEDDIGDFNKKGSSDGVRNLESSDEVDKALAKSEDFLQLYPKHWKVAGTGHNVIIILPRQKWGEFMVSKDLAVSLLAESITLAETLNNWKVVDSMIVSTSSVTKSRLFGSTRLEELVKKVRTNPYATAVFFVVDILSYHQLSELEQIFGVPVFDRYSIVLQIFNEHAKTREAKLQVALAEIPYIKNILKSMEVSKKPQNIPMIKKVGGPGETWIETRKMILREREMRIKKLLDKVQKNRDVFRQNRSKKQLPVVAVVGYTNCGKTSLIKALTKDAKLQPKDVLFATVDATIHGGKLLSNYPILYSDTVGFISHIPTTLIQSFQSTLKEITMANLIIHVFDVSHPDYLFQKRTVVDTLYEIGVSEKLIDLMINVGNKIDLVDDLTPFKEENTILISATKETGLDYLLEIIEKGILESTDRFIATLRVPNGGDAYRWLFKQGGIKRCEADPEDYNFLLMEVLITQTNYEIFKHRFPEGSLVNNKMIE